MVKKGSKGKMKKGGRKGAGGTKKTKKLPKIAEGLSPSEMSKSQLCAFIKRLLAEKDRELEERNLFMLEKNKLWAIWQLTMDKFAVLKDEVRDTQVKIEQSTKVKDKETEEYNKKLRMLQNEEIKNFGIIRINHLHYMRNVSDDIWAIECILRESSLYKKKCVRRSIASFYQIIRGLVLTHADSKSSMLTQLSKAIRDFEILQDRTFFDQKTDWEENFSPQSQQMKIAKMVKLDFSNLAHERTILEMKTFFDDVTTNNLAVMSLLGEEIEAQKLRENRLQRDLKLTKQNYRSIAEPLEKMLEEIQLWESQKKNIQKLHTTLRNNEKTFKSKAHCRHMMEVTNECTRQQISIAIVERNKARVEFGRALREIQRQAQMNSFVHQLKEKAASEDNKLFQAISRNLNKPLNDPIDYFEKLKKGREIKLKAYNMILKNQNETFENYIGDPQGVECTNQQRTTEFGSIGLINRSRVIQKPWRKIQQDSYLLHGNMMRPRYKDIVHPNNIFNQLPQVASSRAPSVSNFSTASTAIISIFPPSKVSLKRITAKRATVVQEHEHEMFTKLPTVHQTLTQENLHQILHKVKWKNESCVNNFEHLQPKQKPNAIINKKCSFKPSPVLKNKSKCRRKT